MKEVLQMIRAIIVDDESLSLQLLEKKLVKTGDVEVVATFSNAEFALEQLQNLDFQVAFLDIEMSSLSGLDLAKIISASNPGIQIVFVTAYRDYAIQAFELNSIDYLLKPVMEERLNKTIARIREQIQLEQHQFGSKQTPTLTIQCFMEFAVYNQEEIVKWKTSKVKELFAYLFMHHHTYIHRDTIIHDLWPNQDYKKAKIQLHTNISYLRKTLTSLGIDHPLQFTNQSYRLKIKNYICDAEVFDELTEKNITDQNITEAEKAIHLYTGGYTEKNAYEWAVPKAKIMKEKLLSFLYQLISYFEKKENGPKKQHYLQLILKHDPYSESAIRQLLQLYLSNGNRIEAITLYKDFTSLLEEDLGILPEPTTSNIMKHILTDNDKGAV